MRILYLIPTISGGGAESQLGYLAPELARMGHDVHIVYINDGPYKPELPGVMVHQLKARNNHSPFLVWQLNHIIRRIKPDLIQTWILQMDILGGLVAKVNSVPWIFREPSSALAYPPTWKYCLRNWMGKAATAIVSNSLGGDEYWKIQGYTGRRHIISNALPLHEIGNAMAALPDGLVESEMPIALYVGRITEGKGLDALLETLACVRKEYKVLTVLCGEGPEQPKLESLRNKLGLDTDVLFTGHLQCSKVWALMKRASVFVSLSEFEGRPNAVMEAMACGCPLVLSDIPAHREILDESCSLFVDPSNIKQTAEIIVQSFRDRDAAKDRSLIAKQKTHEWSIAEMARNYERVYNEVIQN